MYKKAHVIQQKLDEKKVAGNETRRKKHMHTSDNGDNADDEEVRNRGHCTN